MSIFSENEQGILEVYPRYMSELAGVFTVFHAGQKFRLTYIDGTHEEAVIPDSIKIDLDNLFSVTGIVQEFARSGSRHFDHLCVQAGISNTKDK